MPHQVFISYSTRDKTVADTLCAHLEKARIRCWIAPRDIPPGSEWAAAIMEGIALCQVMVLVFSSSANESKQVMREVQQAFDHSLSVIPFRLENVSMHNSLQYYCGPVHWLDALTPPLEVHISKLVERIQALLAAEKMPQQGSRRTTALEPGTPKPKFIWHYIHPDFQQELLSRASAFGHSQSRLWSSSPEKAVASWLIFASGSLVLGETEAEDLRPWLESGAVISFRYKSGTPCLTIDVDALVVTSQDSLLADWLRKLPIAQSPRANAVVTLLKRFLIFGAHPDRSELDAALNVLAPGGCLRAAILHRFYRAPEDARSCLASDGDNVSSVAKSLLVLFGDANAAYAALQKEEIRAKDSRHWTACARAWKETFNDEAAARRCLEKAESIAKASYEWIWAAGGWKDIFNNEAAAHRCLEKAEPIAKGYMEWKWAAEAWKDICDNEAAAHRCLEKAESLVKESYEWTSAAIVWKEILNDDDAARRCLEKAESIAKSSSNWSWAAKWWKEIFSDETVARRCLEKAESIAKSSLDWTSAAEGWKEIDEAAARRCLEKAESIAKSSSDWSWAARGWKEIFSDETVARRCLEKAESIAKSSLDWSWAARGWKEIFSDETVARRCLEKAESIAKSSLDWTSAAEGWKEIDEAAARRCLEKAESIAKSSSDWSWAARGWKEIFSDEGAARRCREKAESAMV